MCESQEDLIPTTQVSNGDMSDVATLYVFVTYTAMKTLLPPE